MPYSALEKPAWATTPFALEPHLILHGFRGSHAHGTYVPPTEPTSIDDIDLMGVVIAPLEYYLGQARFQSAEAIKGEWDTVVYELRFFVSLLCKQNPNVLSLLWLHESDRALTPIGQRLIEARHLFRAKDQAFQCIMGYAHGQLKRMTRIAGQGYLGEKRKGLVERFGYDTKNAAHLLRLLHMGYEYLATGEIHVRRTWDRDQLLAIKRGEWELAAVIAEAHKWFQRCEAAKASSKLPDAIDQAAVNRLCTELILDFHRLAPQAAPRGVPGCCA